MRKLWVKARITFDGVFGADTMNSGGKIRITLKG